MLRLPVFTGFFWPLEGSAASAEDVRYFAFWRYAKSTRTEEIRAEGRSGRMLGCGALRSDEVALKRGRDAAKTLH
jgi:hypothetical protein